MNLILILDSKTGKPFYRMRWIRWNEPKIFHTFVLLLKKKLVLPFSQLKYFK